MGQLILDTTPSKHLDGLAADLKRAGYEYKYLNSQQLRERFPMLKFPSNYCGLIEPSAGILRAGRCVQAFQVIRKHLISTGLIEPTAGILRAGRCVQAFQVIRKHLISTGLIKPTAGTLRAGRCVQAFKVVRKHLILTGLIKPTAGILRTGRCVQFRLSR